jgi:hypothetical protein
MIALAIRLRDFLNDRVIYRDRSRDDPDKTLSEVDQLIESIDTTFMQRGFRASRHRTDLLAALAKHDYEIRRKESHENA